MPAGVARMLRGVSWMSCHSGLNISYRFRCAIVLLAFLRYNGSHAFSDWTEGGEGGEGEGIGMAFSGCVSGGAMPCISDMMEVKVNEVGGKDYVTEQLCYGAMKFKYHGAHVLVDYCHSADKQQGPRQ